MPISRTSLPLTNFQNADGTPVANGTLQIRLNVNGSVNDTQVQSNSYTVRLDASGDVLDSPTFWPNADILPAGTYYVLSVYSQQGQLVGGPNVLTI
jgi:hypothetical protein